MRHGYSHDGDTTRPHTLAFSLRLSDSSLTMRCNSRDRRAAADEDSDTDFAGLAPPAEVEPDGAGEGGITLHRIHVHGLSLLSIDWEWTD